MTINDIEIRLTPIALAATFWQLLRSGSRKNHDPLVVRSFQAAAFIHEQSDMLAWKQLMWVLMTWGGVLR